MRENKRVPFYAELVGGIPTVFSRGSDANDPNIQVAQFDTMKDARKYAAEKNNHADESKNWK